MSCKSNVISLSLGHAHGTKKLDNSLKRNRLAHLVFLNHGRFLYRVKALHNISL